MIAHHRCNHGIDGFRVAYVDLQRRSLSTHARYALGDAARIVRLQVRDDNLSALRGHALGTSLADARAAAHHQGNATREIEQGTVVK
jgi:hypothetical protein